MPHAGIEVLSESMKCSYIDMLSCPKHSWGFWMCLVHFSVSRVRIKPGFQKALSIPCWKRDPFQNLEYSRVKALHVTDLSLRGISCVHVVHILGLRQPGGSRMVHWQITYQLNRQIAVPQLAQRSSFCRGDVSAALLRSGCDGTALPTRAQQPLKSAFRRKHSQTSPDFMQCAWRVWAKTWAPPSVCMFAAAMLVSMQLIQPAGTGPTCCMEIRALRLLHPLTCPNFTPLFSCF